MPRDNGRQGCIVFLIGDGSLFLLTRSRRPSLRFLLCCCLEQPIVTLLYLSLYCFCLLRKHLSERPDTSSKNRESLQVTSDPSWGTHSENGVATRALETLPSLTGSQDLVKIPLAMVLYQVFHRFLACGHPTALPGMVGQVPPASEKGLRRDLSGFWR